MAKKEYKEKDTKSVSNLRQEDRGYSSRNVDTSESTNRNLSNVKEYYVDLQPGQLSSVVLKPKAVVTLVLNENEDIFPECFRSFVNAGILKEKI